MKYLYLQVLRLRVWILRRRLRQMGFREAAERTNADTILRLQKGFCSEPRRYLRWLELAVLIAGLVIWVLCFIRPLEPKETSPRNASKTSAPHRESTPTGQSSRGFNLNRSIT